MSRCPTCGVLQRTRKPLTRQQRAVYDFIAAEYRDEGCAVTYQEVADFFGYRALSTVHEHVTHLRQKGWLEIPRRGGFGASLVPTPSDEAEATDDAS